MGDRDRAIGVDWLTSNLSVDAEALAMFTQYQAALVKWQKVQNLVSRETIEAFWVRHVCDSARLSTLVREPAVWLDFGSGAGFPGLVTAILQARHGAGGAAHVHLVESNSRKVAFLRTVIREAGIAATVHDQRIENLDLPASGAVSYISARALAPLHYLLGLAKPYTDRGARCYFHKGRDIDREIADAANAWAFDLIKHETSLPGNALNDGVILEIGAIKHRIV